MNEAIKGDIISRVLAQKNVCRFVSPLFVSNYFVRITDTNTTLRKKRGWRKDLERADLLQEDQEDQRRERRILIHQNIFAKGKRNVEDCWKR